MRRVLHCSAFGQGDRWQAYCLDLDLAVEGRSFSDVEQRLTDAIGSYLEAVMELPENERGALLGRRMPFLVRLQFAIRAFLASIRDRDDADYQHQFTMPCPA